jgi:hypothetical protein
MIKDNLFVNKIKNKHLILEFKLKGHVNQLENNQMHHKISNKKNS